MTPSFPEFCAQEGIHGKDADFALKAWLAARSYVLQCICIRLGYDVESIKPELDDAEE